MLIELTRGGNVSDFSSASFDGRLDSGGLVRERDLTSIAKSCKCRIANDLDDRPLNVESMVRIARANLGQRQYHLLTMNCECFANACRYGYATSPQLSPWRPWSLRWEKDCTGSPFYKPRRTYRGAMEGKTESFRRKVLNDQSYHLRTSVEIIEEARMSMPSNEGGAKLVASTRRPQTPNYSSAKWIRRYAFAKLLPILPEKHHLTKQNSASLISIQSEPESSWRKLTPLPEVYNRSQSVNESTEKRAVPLRRRRPLSVVTTALRCDEILELIGHDAEAEGFLPSLPPSYPMNATRANLEASGALKPPRMVLKNRDNSYDSGLSSASIEETSYSMTDDERSPSRASPRMNEAVQMYMKQINSICVKGNISDSEIDAWAESFNCCLSNGKLLFVRGQLQVSILQELFRASEFLKPKPAIRIYAIILSMNVTGQNLIKVCKELYSLCGSVESLELFSYDLFLNHFLMTINRLSNHDVIPMIYIARIADMLTSNEQIRSRLLELKIFRAIVHITGLLGDHIHQGSHPNNIPAVLIATPILSSIRNLLDCGEIAEEDLLRQGVLQGLFLMMDAFAKEEELMLYGMRTLSKISTIEECCEQLVTLKPDFFQCSANWLNIYSKNPDIIVRLLFVLGNLLSIVERAQWQLFQADGVIDSLGNILDHYLEIRQQISQLKHCDPAGCTDVHSESVADENSRQGFFASEDVLVKLTRVVANLSVHPGVGGILCQNEKIIDQLCAVLEASVEYSESTTDELTVNSLVALHNLSFYSIENGLNLRIQNRVGDTVQSVINSNTSVYTLSEACSLLANLSRNIEFAEWLLEKKFHQQLIVFVASNSNVQLTRSAAGTLVNLSRCFKYHKMLLNDGLLKNTFELLANSVSTYDWCLASLAIQITCNMIRTTDDCSNIDLHVRTVDYPTLKDVARLILNHTDDFTATCPSELADKELASHLRHVWEHDFCSASTHLLETLDATII